MHMRPERIDAVRLADIALAEPSITDFTTMMVWGRNSDLMLAYWADRELVALAGFIPMPGLFPPAYLWMHSTPAVARYKIAVGRWGIWTLAEARKRYSKIVGECVAGTRSVEWLSRLGAKFHAPTVPGLAPFSIGV